MTESTCPMTLSPTKPRCSVRKANGAQCQKPAQDGETTCYYHSPNRNPDTKCHYTWTDGEGHEHPCERYAMHGSPFCQRHNRNTLPAKISKVMPPSVHEVMVQSLQQPWQGLNTDLETRIQAHLNRADQTSSRSHLALTDALIEERLRTRGSGECGAGWRLVHKLIREAHGTLERGETYALDTMLSLMADVTAEGMNRDEEDNYIQTLLELRRKQAESEDRHITTLRTNLTQERAMNYADTFAQHTLAELKAETLLQHYRDFCELNPGGGDAEAFQYIASQTKRRIGERYRRIVREQTAGTVPGG